MAYKINGTTVVDNSRNVCACCVTSCCITASTRMDAPSGNTASRPSSPATGSLYFDTDEGSLLSYDGSEWKAGGSAGKATKFAVPVTDWIGPFHSCCSTSTGVGGCKGDSLNITMNERTCEVFLISFYNNCQKCPNFRALSFNPSTCAVTYTCCSCPCCQGSAGASSLAANCAHFYGNFTKNNIMHFPCHSIAWNCNALCCCGRAFILGTGNTCLVTLVDCLCASVICKNFNVGGSTAAVTCTERLFCINKQGCMGYTWDGCCAWAIVPGVCFNCCANTACNGNGWAFVSIDGPIVNPSTHVPYCHCLRPLLTGPVDANSCCRYLTYTSGTAAECYNRVEIVSQFCNGYLYSFAKSCSSFVQIGYMFMCNDYTFHNVMAPCSNGNPRCYFCKGVNCFPSSMTHSAVTRPAPNALMHHWSGCRCCTHFFSTIFKHTEGTACFDVTDQFAFPVHQPFSRCCPGNAQRAFFYHFGAPMYTCRCNCLYRSFREGVDRPIIPLNYLMYHNQNTVNTVDGTYFNELWGHNSPDYTGFQSCAIDQECPCYLPAEYYGQTSSNYRSTISFAFAHDVKNDQDPALGYGRNSVLPTQVPCDYMDFFTNAAAMSASQTYHCHDSTFCTCDANIHCTVWGGNEHGCCLFGALTCKRYCSGTKHSNWIRIYKGS